MRFTDMIKRTPARGILNLIFMVLLVFAAFVSGKRTLEPLSAHAATAAGPNVVNVVAREYRFELPDTLPAGPTLFHLTDAGNQLHHMTIVKFGQGKTLADFSALPPGPFPAWVEFIGGPNTPTPHGGQDEDIVDLSPGNYAVLCLIPGPDGKPHVADGMIKSLTVTDASDMRNMPDDDLTLTLSNYKFAFSKPLTAGKHVIRVVNDGSQIHEAVMFRLAAGKTGADIFKWVGDGMQGPPPAAPVAGISPESPGKYNLLPLDLLPGDYALLCFLPDAMDGNPHAAHGMIYDFKVI